MREVDHAAEACGLSQPNLGLGGRYESCCAGRSAPKEASAGEMPSHGFIAARCTHARSLAILRCKRFSSEFTVDKISLADAPMLPLQSARKLRPCTYPSSKVVIP